MSFKILSYVSELQTNILEFFKELNVEVFHDESRAYDYLLIDDPLEIKIISKRHPEAKIISLEHPDDKLEFITNNGVLVLDESILISNYGVNLYNRFFSSSPSPHFLEQFEKIYSDEFKFKVSSLSSTGVYFDEIFEYFDSKGFDKIKSRIFLDQCILFYSLLDQVLDFPVEIEGASSGDSIGVNLSVGCSFNGLMDKMYQHNDFQRVLLGLIDNCKFLEMSFVKESARLNICAIWDKNLDMKTAVSFIDIPRLDQVLKKINFKPSLENFVTSQIKGIDKIHSEMISSKELDEADFETITNDIFSDDAEEELKSELEEKIQKLSFNTDLVKKEVLENIKQKTGEDADDFESVPDDYLEDEITSVDNNLSKEELENQKIKSLSDDDKEFISNVSGAKDEKTFVQKISSSVKDGLKAEMMRVKSSGSGESLSIDGLMRSIISSAKDKGAIKDGSEAFLSSMSSDDLAEKVMSLMSFDTSSEDEEKIKKLEEREALLKAKAYKFEREAKILSVELKKTETMFESEFSRIQRSIDSRDKVVTKTKETLKSITAHKDKEIAELNRRVESLKQESERGLSSKDEDSENKLEKHLLKKLDREKTTSRQLITELSKSKKDQKAFILRQEGYQNQIKKLEFAIKGLQARSDKKAGSGGMSIREKRLDAGLKKLQLELGKSKNESASLKRDFMKMKNENMSLKNQINRSKVKKAS